MSPLLSCGNIFPFDIKKIFVISQKTVLEITNACYKPSKGPLYWRWPNPLGRVCQCAHDHHKDRHFCQTTDVCGLQNTNHNSVYLKFIGVDIHHHVIDGFHEVVRIGLTKPHFCLLSVCPTLSGVCDNVIVTSKRHHCVIIAILGDAACLAATCMLQYAKQYLDILIHLKYFQAFSILKLICFAVISNYFQLKNFTNINQIRFAVIHMFDAFVFE